MHYSVSSSTASEWSTDVDPVKPWKMKIFYCRDGKRDEERYKLLKKEKNVFAAAAAGGHLLIWALAGGPHKAWVERDVR